jgi:hypothetical protein
LEQIQESNKYLQAVFVFMEHFLQISTNVCSKKLLVLGKESKNIQPGNAELKRKGVKHTNVEIYCTWLLSTGVNISRGIMHSTSTMTFGECSCKYLIQNCN